MKLHFVSINLILGLKTFPIRERENNQRRCIWKTSEELGERGEEGQAERERISWKETSEKSSGLFAKQRERFAPVRGSVSFIRRKPEAARSKLSL